MESIYRLYSSLPQLEQEKNRAEIDLDALRQNYRSLLEIARRDDPEVRLIAVVKAEAYGHGAPRCVSALLDEGCSFFAVSSIDEAVAVRSVCDNRQKNADILILGYTSPSLTFQLVRYDIIQTLLSAEYADQLNLAASAAGVTVRTHVAVDTGMNRIGIPVHSEEELSAATETVACIMHHSHLRVEGMFTHFSRADEEEGGEGETFTELQSKRYRSLLSNLEARGIFIPFHHTCNSAATVRRVCDRMNGVRVGILLYGARPSDHVDVPSLKPVLKLKSVISHLHPLLPGESVGYGGIYRAESKRLIATVPIGYADGFLKAYSGALATVETASGKKSAPIVGNVCMDQCMIDVTDTGAQVGDTITFFGNHPTELYDYAKRAGIINYECLCLLSSRVPRIYQTEQENSDEI